jgi:dihydrofolate reductase
VIVGLDESSHQRGALWMRTVTYSMGVSLDGYIVGPAGDFDWTAPDEEVFRFVTDELREVGVHLMGRRLYETMLYWETADQDPSLDHSMLQWAAIWKPLPKVVVFSTTLSAVQGSARLASGSLAEEIGRLRTEPGEGAIAIGGRDSRRRGGRLGSHRRVPGQGLPGAGRRWHSVLPQQSVDRTSSSSTPAPSARRSSTCATAWRLR